MRLYLVTLVGLCGCSSPAAPAVDAGFDAGHRVDGGTYPLWLEHGAFDAGEAPSAIVFVPPGLDSAAPVEVHVFFHGVNSCAWAVLRAGPVDCTDAGTPRDGLDLGAQLTDAGGNALLLVPETLIGLPSSDPGRFADDGGFRLFLDEVLLKLRPELGAVTVSRVSLSTMRVGTAPVAQVLLHGEVPIDDVYLLDALFSYVSTFEGWIAADPQRHRFASIYTATGGTEGNSQAMAADVAALDAGALLIGASPVTDEELHARQIFVFSPTPMPGDWLGRLWRTAR